MKISKYLTLEEATKSPNAIKLGIDNTPNDEQLAAMKLTATKIFDPVREYVNGPLHASSFFRSAKLNSSTPGASNTSQHMTGEAVDMDCDTFGYGTNNQIFDWISKTLVFDQLIGEYPDETGKFAWTHCSYSQKRNRKQRLVKLKAGYVPFESWTPGQV